MRDASQPADPGPTGAAPTAAARRAAFLPRGRWAVAVGVPAGLMAVVVALRLWLEYVGPLPGDRWALDHILHGQKIGQIYDVAEFFQTAGTPLIALLTVAWASLFVARTDGWRAVAFVLLAAGRVAFNMLLKGLFGATPLMKQVIADPNHSFGNNYPSGHTVYATVVFGALAWLAWRHREWLIAAAFLFLIVLMGPFRVIGEAHFVSDVVAGYLVGLAWLVPAAIVTGHASRTARPRTG